MMKKPKSPAAQAVTANTADTGRTVFRTPAGQWSPRIADAKVVLTTSEGDALLAAAIADADANIVVDPYMIEVAQENGVWQPTRLREIIRAQGPTIPRASYDTPAA